MARKQPTKDAPAPSRPDLLDILASGFPPAFATDADRRIVFWNKGRRSSRTACRQGPSEALLRRRAEGRPRRFTTGVPSSPRRGAGAVISYEFTVPSGTLTKHLSHGGQIPGQRRSCSRSSHLQQVDQAAPS
jgi:hypothetical protein